MFGFPPQLPPSLNDLPVSEDSKVQLEALLRQKIVCVQQKNQELRQTIHQPVPVLFEPLDFQKSTSEMENILKQKIEEQKKRADELRQEAERRRQERMDERLTSLDFNAMDEQLDRIEVHQTLNEESVQRVNQDIEEIREENRELAQQTDHLEAQYIAMGEQAESINQKQDIIQGEIQQVKVLHTSLEQQTGVIEQELAVREQELNEIEQRQVNIQHHLEQGGFSSVLSQAQTIASRTQQLASQLINQSKQTITHTAQRALAAGSRLYSFCKDITKKALKYIIQRICAFVKRIFLSPITWIALTILSYYIVRERTLLYIAAGILFYTLMAGRVKHWLIQP